MHWFRNTSITGKLLIPPVIIATLLGLIALLGMGTRAGPDGRWVEAWQVSFALGLTLVANFLAALISTRLIAQPIHRISDALEELAAGDLSAEFGELDRQDEIGAMSRALEKFRANALEREQLAAELAVSEQRFRRLVEATFEGIVIHDQGIILDANEAYAKLFGYELAELIGRDAVEFTASESRELVRRHIRHGWEAPYEAIGRRRDGSHFPIEIHGKTIAMPDGRARVTAVRDISRRKRAEEALRQKTVQLEGLRQVSLELSAELDLDMLLHFLVTRAVDMVSGDGGFMSLYQPERDLIEVITVSGIDYHTIQPTLYRYQGLTGRVFATGKPHYQNDYHLWEGSATEEGSVPKAVVAVPLRWGDEFLGVLTVVAYGEQRFSSTDAELLSLLASQAAVAIINARLHHRVQQHAEEMELRVHERTQALSAANERLKGLDRLKSQFISDVSHELRTPLTNLVLYLDLLERSAPEKHPRYMAVIRAKSDQLVHFTEDILRISRLSLYEDEADFSRADLNDIVRHIVDASQKQAEASGLTLSFRPAPNLPAIQAETNLLAQAFASLLDNAIAYTSQGEITVVTELDEERGQLMLQITDTGMGIGEEDLPHIFDRFYRGRQVGQLDKPGTGLGLAVFKETIDLHGGQVEVASHEGLGTVFRAWLPLPQQPEPAPPVS